MHIGVCKIVETEQYGSGVRCDFMQNATYCDSAGSGLMAGRHSFGFSRNSMSAAASPFVPAAMQTQRASQFQHAHSASASTSAAAADLLSRSGSRTEPPEGSVSRVILKTSMSGSLGERLS